MLGKLMKYEFKATSRMLLPINGAMLLFALINRLFMELNFFQTGNGGHVRHGDHRRLCHYADRHYSAVL